MTMTKTEQKSLRMTPETVQQAYHLAHIWSPIRPLSLADVVAECVRRNYEIETRTKEKRR